jgi:hypothetical protein
MDTNGRENKRAHPTAEERRLIFLNPLPDFGAPYLPASVSWLLFVFIRVHSRLVFSPCPLRLCGEIISQLQPRRISVSERSGRHLGAALGNGPR